MTRDELGGLEDSLLGLARPPTGAACFTDWQAAKDETLGRSYVPEPARNWNGVEVH